MYKITNMLIWFENGKYVQDEHGQILLSEKPVFSFNFDSIRYYWNEQIYIQNDEQYSLSDVQQKEIEAFIKNKREEVGILKPVVDKDGFFLGIKRIDSSDVYGIVPTSPPTADSWIWDFEQKQWTRIFYYDAEYNIVFNSEESIGFTTKPYPTDLPFPHKYSIERDAWIYSTDDNNTERIKNKALLDVIITFITTFVSIQNSPTKEKEILDYIANLLKNDEYINSMITLYFQGKYANSVNAIIDDEKTVLDSYVESVNFSSYCNKKIGKMLYNLNTATVADIIVEETLKANT